MSEAPILYRGPQNYKVQLYHDFENCDLNDDEAVNIKKNITKALRKVHPDYYLASKIIAIGNTNLGFIQRNELVLRNQGYEFTHVRARRLECKCGKVYYGSGQAFTHQRVKDVADRMIIQDITRRLYENRSIVNFMLISGDSDFTLPLKILESHGIKTFLAANSHARRDFVNTVSHLFKWNAVKDGTASPER